MTEQTMDVFRIMGSPRKEDSAERYWPGARWRAIDRAGRFVTFVLSPAPKRQPGTRSVMALFDDRDQWNGSHGWE